MMIDAIRATIAAMIAEDRTMIDMDRNGAVTGKSLIILVFSENQSF